MKNAKNTKSTKNTKTLASTFFDSKNKVIGACVITAAVILIAAVLMFVESGYGKWSIKNKTDLKLEYVKTSFINADSTVAEGIQTESIAANDTYNEELSELKLFKSESNMEVRFKFENSKEMFTDVGYFMDDFQGNVKITFEKTDDPNLLKLKIKAGNGIFQTKTVNCNEEFTVNLSEGSIIE